MNNNYENVLYQNLMNLVGSNEAFYFIDTPLNDVIYRVFTYRLASYMDFLAPDALECRGHMFRLNSNKQMDELVSLPLCKFFNAGENPFTMDLDFSTTEFIHDKRDGSLISTYLHDNMVCVKSKTALASDQALAANKILYNDPVLFALVDELVRSYHTVIFEYTSPTNRIVLPYQTDELRVLAVRDNTNGAYIKYELLYRMFGDYMVEDHTFMVNDPVTFVQDIPDMKGIEGFVIGLDTGMRVKVKTAEYLSLHRAKDSINSNKRLFEVAINGATDDLRSLFSNDQYTLDRITQMEQIAGQAYNHLVKSVEDYHEENKELDRKSYAIKGQQELDRIGFNLAMMKYVGKTPDYRGMLMKNFKDFVEDNDTDIDVQN